MPYVAVLHNIFKLYFLIGLIANDLLFAVHFKRISQNRTIDARKTRLDIPLWVLALLGTQAIPVVYALTSWLDFADYHLPTWFGLFGAGLLAVALWLYWRSHAVLGRNWSPSLEIREGHSLVTRGVYRYVRHPIYAADWLWGIAQALLLQNWIAGLSCLASSLPIYLYRVAREEQMMVDHFGEEYREYITRTGRIIPRSWR